MTTKQAPDQELRKERAVWLGRVPADGSDDGASGEDRFEANRVGRREFAAIVGGFLYSQSGTPDLSDPAWRELLAFLRHMQATVLVVLGPQEIAHGFEDYYRRTMDLEEDGVRLVFPEGIGLRRPPRSSVERSAA